MNALHRRAGRSLALLVTAAAVVACTHSFEPPASGSSGASAADRDNPRGPKADAAASSDGFVLPDGRARVRDLRGADGCSAAPVKPPVTTGDCRRASDWACLSTCGAVGRAACVHGGRLLREVRCDARGQCECRVGATITRCRGVALHGRMGCTAAQEQLRSGCCLVGR